MLARLSGCFVAFLALTPVSTSASPAARQPSPAPGAISAPANGTHLAPGGAFDFAYGVHADYGVSSYNYTVWLLTALPSFALAAGGDVAAGHYFGRFSYPNYPGNPDPKNLAPPQLVTPDFSQSPGGFGSGKSADDVPVYLVVVEEWANGVGALGSRISVAVNQVVYNATT